MICPICPRILIILKVDVREYLYLLAQIDFVEVPKLKGLPGQEVLQFYLAAKENLGGIANFSSVRSHFEKLNLTRVLYNWDCSRYFCVGWAIATIKLKKPNCCEQIDIAYLD